MKASKMICPVCKADLLGKEISAGGCSHIHGQYKIWYAVNMIYPNGETDVRGIPSTRSLLKIDRLVDLDTIIGLMTLI